MTVKEIKEKVLISPEKINSSLGCFEVLGTFNPAATRLPNGDIALYVRIIERLIKRETKKCFCSPRMIGKEKFKLKIDKFEKKNIKDRSDMDFVFKDGTKRLTFISHLRKVILDKSGFNIKHIDEKPSFFGLAHDGELGIEDPRITKINNLYVMTYVSLSRYGGISTSYAVSNDCNGWYRRGVIFGQQDKDVVLFPEMIDNKYVAFDRPEGSFQFTPPHIWIAYSKNLEFWGRARSIRLSKRGDWDFTRLGAGPPPIKTRKGWLLIYHVATDSSKTVRYESLLGKIKTSLKADQEEKQTVPIYYAGAALFDLKNPRKLIAKTQKPLIIPNKEHEKGTFEEKRVIFPTGIVQTLDKKNVLLYSGAGDTLTTVKKISLKDIMACLKKV